jgi:hypothetical protein
MRAIAVLLFLTTAALAHSWYPVECCGEYDCSPIDDARVRVVEGGYLVDGKHFIETSRVRQSKDSDYHACFWPADRLWCFFIPPMGS